MRAITLFLVGIVFLAIKCNSKSATNQTENFYKQHIPSSKRLLLKYKTNYIDDQIIAKDGVIYFGDMLGFIYAMDTSGILKWKMQMNRSDISNLTFANDTVLCVELGDSLAGINIKTQSVLWYSNIGRTLGLQLKAKNNILYLSCLDSFFYCINSINGKIINKIPFAGITNFGGEVFLSASQVYFLAGDTILPIALFKIDNDGILKSKIPLSNYGLENPVNDEDILICKYRHHEFKSIDLKTGKERWVYENKPEIGDAPEIRLGDFLINNGTAYTNLTDSEICAINVKTGELKWKVNCHGDLLSIFYIGRDELYFSSHNICYSIDLNSRKIKFEFSISDIIRFPMYYNHTFYFTSKDSSLYAIKDSI